MSVEGLLSLPFLNDRKVVRAHRVKKDVKAEIAFLFPACVGELFQQIGCIRALAADIDVRDHEDAPAVGGFTRRAEGQRFVRTLVDVAYTDGIDFGPEV